MGKHMTLTASDGHELDAYLSEPNVTPRAALVIVQEVFGVNQHIRNVTDSFSARGFACIAPAMFDRIEKNVDCPYTPEGIEKARSYVPKLDWNNTVLDVKAASDHLRGFGQVGLVGYCWGGSVAWLSATREAGVHASVGYYGGRIIDFVEEKPAIPVMLHFGDKDEGIPIDTVQQIRSAHPEITLHRYAEADHGFNCDQRGSYHAESAQLALKRSLEFLEENLV